MTLSQARTEVDNWLAGIWPTITSRQDTYFSNHGAYWQGLATHSVVPAFTSSVDGSSAPDLLDQGPTNAVQKWIDVFPDWVGVAIPCAVRCDVYEGPKGKGYVATVRVGYAGTLYQRSQNVGPETERTQGWAAVNENPFQ